ncbi:MAG: hypothetical protein QXS54_04245 [Candidatus Methanomethylicaceae archaeon]
MLLSHISKPEYMAINALLMILEDYKERAKKSYTYADEVGAYVNLITLVLPEEEFYRAFCSAYGLKKTKWGYDKKARAVALEALKKLDERRYTVPLRLVAKVGEIAIKNVERVRLVEMVHETKTTYEGNNVLKGEGSHITLKLHWVLTYGIDDFYTLRRRDKNAIIASHAKTRKEVYAVIRLTDFLETLDLNSVKFSEQKLAQIIGCKSLLKDRKRKQLQKRIERTLELTKESGWISNYKRDGDTYVLTLNPEFCCRVGKGNKLQKRTK